MTATSAAANRWTTRFTRDFPWCSLPIMGAPMAGHSGGELAAAVGRAGGVGFIGAGHAVDSDDGVQDLQDEISVFQSSHHHHQRRQTIPLCMGFIGHSSFRKAENWQRLEQVLAKHQPKVVQFFAPALSTVPDNAVLEAHVSSELNNVTLCQHYGAKVLVQVGTVEDAMVARSWGVDGIICQGTEAGGHGLRQHLGNATLPLVTTVISRIRSSSQSSDIPILAAGGIVDGPTMAAFMAAGCDGVVLGTRLWASHESIGHHTYKERLVSSDSDCDRITRTTTFDWIQNTYTTTPWPFPYDSLGGIKNQTSKRWEGRENELHSLLASSKSFSDSTQAMIEKYRQANEDGNPEIGLVHAGEGVGLIESLEPATELVMQIASEAEQILKSAPSRLFAS